MALNPNSTLVDPIQLNATAGTDSSVSILLGTGAPDGNTSPASDAAKSSFYIRTDATDDQPCLYLKVDADSADDDWVPVVIEKDESAHQMENNWTWTADKKLYLRDTAIYIHSNTDGAMTITADGHIYIGDGTNQVDIQADGEIQLEGTARVTKSVQLPAGEWGTGNTAATYSRAGNYPGYTFGIDDSMVATFKVPEDIDTSANLTPKVYWYCNEAYSATSGEVQWSVPFSVVASNSTESVTAPGYSGTLDPGDQNLPGTAMYMTVISAGTITGTSVTAGDIVGLTLRRLALDDGNNPTAEPVAVLMTVEYTAGRLGTAT